jgi:plastocyanin
MPSTALSMRIALLAAAVVLAACGTRDSRQPAPAAGARLGIVHMVRMTETNEFAPQEVRIRVGDAVEWRNLSPTGQTVTALRSASPTLVTLPTGANEFDSGRIASGGTYTHQFTIAGRYQYISIANAGVDMVGTILVVER